MALTKTKKLRKEEILTSLYNMIDSGKSPEQAFESIPLDDYDFLVDTGFDTDQLLLTAEQRKAAQEVKAVKRGLSPNGYNKKYPIEKQNLYNSVLEHIASIGGIVIPREKQNYRDLDFTLNGKKYKIVISEPRK